MKTMALLTFMLCMSSITKAADCISQGKHYSGDELTNALLCMQTGMKSILNSAIDKGVSIYEDQDIVVYSSEATQEGTTVNITVIVKNKKNSPLDVYIKNDELFAVDDNKRSCTSFSVNPAYISSYGGSTGYNPNPTIQPRSEQIFIITERCGTQVVNFGVPAYIHNDISGMVDLKFQIHLRYKKSKSYISRLINLNNVFIQENVPINN